MLTRFHLRLASSGNDDFDDVRQRLEALLECEQPQQQKILPTATMVDLSFEAPPLTTLERQRKEAELHLLEQLQDGDDAIAELWTLWFHERGPQAAQRLVQAEEFTKSPSTYPSAEALLHELVQEYGVAWAEPVNRLATLYYLQGKHSESRALCELVLQVKPWHFGALSGLVQVLAQLHLPDQAREWASRRLPSWAPTGPNRRRHVWVERAVHEAQLSLEEAEAHLRESWGPPDVYEEAWQ